MKFMLLSLLAVLLIAAVNSAMFGAGKLFQIYFILFASRIL